MELSPSFYWPQAAGLIAPAWLTKQVQIHLNDIEHTLVISQISGLSLFPDVGKLTRKPGAPSFGAHGKVQTRKHLPESETCTLPTP